MSPTSRLVRTTCTMDCPDSCTFEVVVRDGVVDRIRAVEPLETQHPNTQGFICRKVARFAERVYHDSRILHPLRRVGAKGEPRFERISSDEALGTIADRFRSVAERWGAEAILPDQYDGSNGLLSHEFLDAYLFARLGASRLKRTLCAAPATAVAMGMHGQMPRLAFEDLPNARAILIWGANPRFSNIHLVPYLKKSEARAPSSQPLIRFATAVPPTSISTFPSTRGTDPPRGIVDNPAMAGTGSA